jgi:hypothetical protein
VLATRFFRIVYKIRPRIVFCRKICIRNGVLNVFLIHLNVDGGTLKLSDLENFIGNPFFRGLSDWVNFLE